MCGLGVHSWGRELLPLLLSSYSRDSCTLGSASSYKDLQPTIQSISSRCLQRHGFVLIIFYISGESVWQRGSGGLFKASISPNTLRNMHMDYWHTKFHIPGLLSTSALNVMETTGAWYNCLGIGLWTSLCHFGESFSDLLH